MTAAVIWLIAGLALIAAEVLSGEFVLLMLGGGALVAAAGPRWSVRARWSGAVVFARRPSVLLLFAVRPPLRRRLDRGIAPRRRCTPRRWSADRRSWSPGWTATAAG